MDGQPRAADTAGGGVTGVAMAVDRVAGGVMWLAAQALFD
jgi:hypothetical protein